MSARSFLELVWPEGLPEGGEVRLSAADFGRHAGFASLESAATAIEAGGFAYWTVASVRPGLAAHLKGGEADVIALPGLWADIDHGGGRHGAPPEGLAHPTREEALELIHERLPLRASIVLDSGGGFYALWLFREPLLLATDAERALAKELSEGWQGCIRTIAAARGWHVDATANLDRVLRAECAPTKYGGRVTRVLESAARFNPIDFEEWLSDDNGRASRSAGSPPVDLPKDLPKHVAQPLEAAGWTVQSIKRSAGGGISAVVLELCPYCGGRERAGSVARGTAHVAPLTGKLRCKRESCDARGDGVRRSTWVRRFAPQLASQPLSPTPVELWPEDARAPVALTGAATAVEALIDDALAWARENSGVAVVQVPPGAGKTTALLERMREDPRFIYLAENYRILEEKARELGVPVHVRPSFASACFYQSGVREAARRNWMLQWRVAACFGYFKEGKECEHRQSCLVFQKPPNDRVLFAPHAALEFLTDDELRGRVLVVDEVPEPLRLGKASLADVAAAKHAVVRSGFGGFPPVMDCVERFVQFAAARIEASEHVAGLDGEALRAAWADFSASDPAASVAIASAHGLLYIDELGAMHARRHPFSLPPVTQLRTPPGEWLLSYANPAVVDVLEAIYGLTLGPEAAVAAETEHGRLRIVQKRGATAGCEVRRVVRMPAPHGTLVLAADGHVRLPDIERMAGGRPVKLFALRVEAPSTEVARVFIEAGRTTLSRRNILSGHALNQRGVLLLGRVLSITAREAKARIGRTATLGIITLKPVASAIRRALGKEEAGRHAPEHVLLWERMLRERLEDASEHLSLDPRHVGHYELVGRGSNEFEQLDVLLLFAAPIPNLGQQAADAEALGQEPQDRLDRLVAASLLQAEGRARAIRGGRKLIVCAGQVRPPGWEDAEVVPLGRGPLESPLRNLVQDLVAEHAADPLAPFAAAWRVRKAVEEVRQVSNSRDSIADLAHLPLRTLQRWIADDAKVLGLVRVAVPLDCRTVYAQPGTPHEAVRAAAVDLWHSSGAEAQSAAPPGTIADPLLAIRPGSLLVQAVRAEQERWRQLRPLLLQTLRRAQSEPPPPIELLRRAQGPAQLRLLRGALSAAGGVA